MCLRATLISLRERKKNEVAGSAGEHVPSLSHVRNEFDREKWRGKMYTHCQFSSPSVNTTQHTRGKLFFSPLHNAPSGLGAGEEEKLEFFLLLFFLSLLRSVPASYGCCLLRELQMANSTQLFISLLRLITVIFFRVKRASQPLEFTINRTIHNTLFGVFIFTQSRRDKNFRL
jgi:hypothetical protein